MTSTHTAILARPHRTAGFTLIELMIALSILAILAGLALPAMRDFVIGQRVKTASFDIYASLTFARSEAIKRNGDVTVTPATGGWQNGWTAASGTSVLKMQNAYPSTVAITGPTSLTYGKDGRLSSVGVQFSVNASPALPGVTPRCITIDLSGRPNSKTGAC